MRPRDFFAFCTTLKPPELKAIGELSWVRHLAEGEVLYSPGEPGNALYIINRGVLEALFQKGRQNAKSVFLGRGDVTGDIEVFLGILRTQLVRAQEAASLQCFPRANFPGLLRLVPSFYQFVCEQTAYRLLTERDLAGEQNDCRELSGRISNFDPTTIHQTIVSSGQTGELSIKDENTEPLGAFYFESGRLCAGQFQHLTGEDAFWQLFLSDQLSGTFSFSVGQRRLTDWIESGQIRRSGGDMLITALQFRDELEALKKGMHQGSEKLSARTTELRWTGGAHDQLRELAEQILELLARGPKTMGDLYRQCSVCELKIYQVVTELLYSDQVSFADAVHQSNGEAAPTIKRDLEAKGVQLTQP
jgi:CRP-like cAMP-binding protein